MQSNELSPTSMSPNDSRYISFQTQDLGKMDLCHFAGFQHHFCLNMTSQTQCCKRMKKNEKCNISELCCMICLKLCRLLELSKGILLDFKFRCYGNQNQNNCLLLKKQKVCCLSKSDVQTVI